MRHQVRIGGMSCSFCVGTIQKACHQLDGVESVSVSLAHEEALFEYDPSRIEPWQIEQMLRDLGYKVYDKRKLVSYEEQELLLRRERGRLAVSAGLTSIALFLMLNMWLGVPQSWSVYVMLSTAMLNVFVVGLPILKMAYHSVRRRILNQHVLLELGAFGSLIGGFTGFLIPNFPSGDFFAVAVFVTSYHILSGYVSLKVQTKSSQAVRRLLDLQPSTARAIRDGREVVLNVEDLRPGDIVRIRPGENIPVDGTVIDGASTVDEHIVTGEYLPVEKIPDDKVIGGSMNLTGVLDVRVTHLGEESFLYRIARSIEEAKALKPNILQLVDVVLRYYVPLVLLASVIGFVTWSLGAWIFMGSPDFIRAIYAALSVLVMGYPCALGMASPLAMIRGGGMAAEKGILMRSSAAFQVLKDIDIIVFDKTGTITEGRPQLIEVLSFNGFDEADVLEVAVSVEQFSEHPLAKAIVTRGNALDVQTAPVTDFRILPGQGVQARLNGKAVLIGNVPYLQQNGIDLSAGENRVTKMESRGETVVGVAYDGELIGLLGLFDTIKADAQHTILLLKKEGIDLMMLTGDNETTAHAVATRVGIDHVISRVLPDQKVEKIRSLQTMGRRVAMVGDGINDAPSLMQADVGIAIGAGTDIAIESADVIIMGEDLRAVIDVYHIGKNSYNKTKFNLILAFLFNGLGVPAAVTGLLHPVWAMAAMIASVSTILLNSFGGRLVPKFKRSSTTSSKVSMYRIPSMHCAGCLSSIIETVTKIDGVLSVYGDVLQKTLTVSHEDVPQLADEILRAILVAGYKDVQRVLTG